MISQRGFEDAIKNNNIEKIKTILQQKIFNPSAYNNYLIKMAANLGRLEIFTLLHNDPRTNPTTENDWAIRNASKNGHFAIVKLLLNDERVNPLTLQNSAIYFAYNNNHQDIVQLLWKNKLIKKNLVKHEPKLYNILLENDIKNKISEF
jgi:hypothetical protein